MDYLSENIPFVKSNSFFDIPARNILSYMSIEDLNLLREHVISKKNAWGIIDVIKSKVTMSPELVNLLSIFETLRKE